MPAAVAGFGIFAVDCPAPFDAVETISPCRFVAVEIVAPAY